jgi:ParB family transcriptional regulator, chromosome partitioning protein
MIEMKKQALGRGLSALLDPSDEGDIERGSTPVSILPMESILPGRFQPRHYFPEEELLALASSIREKGILQPILVRIHPEQREKYEIIAGERRWRAAKKVDLNHIPALIKEFSDVEALEVGLLENIQRQDLNPIEEAEGYRRLADEFNHTQESLSRILGKSRSYIANSVRLLTLPKKVIDYLNEGKLSAGHGRAVLGAEDPELLADMIIERRLNVRQAERLSRRQLTKEEGISLVRESDPEKEVLQKHLSNLLGAAVDLNLKGMGGKIVISFKNPIELDEIIKKFNVLTQLLPTKYPNLKIY